MKYSVVIPTLNSGDLWLDWIDAVKAQSIQPETVLVIDSSSDDSTVSISEANGFNVKVISRSEFNHGATRQLGVDTLKDAEVIVFLTQDAILANPDALKNIISAFNDPKVGVAYGRQLPRLEAGLIESHARNFNYSSKSRIKSFADRHKLGLKTPFVSNSFAAYRRSALIDAGGFPCNTIVSEDMYVAAKALKKNWLVAYCADSLVYHSHDYSMFQEFQRYFDIGVFNARESWIRQSFGGAESEGGRFVSSELHYLLKNSPILIPQAMFRTLLKLLGYRLGLSESLIPHKFKRVLSMQKSYWKQIS